MNSHILGVFSEYIAGRQGHGTTTAGCKYIVSSLLYALTTTPGRGTFPNESCSSKLRRPVTTQGVPETKHTKLRTALQGKTTQQKPLTVPGGRDLGSVGRAARGACSLPSSNHYCSANTINNNTNSSRTVTTQGVPEPTLCNKAISVRALFHCIHNSRTKGYHNFEPVHIEMWGQQRRGPVPGWSLAIE